MRPGRGCGMGDRTGDGSGRWLGTGRPQESQRVSVTRIGGIWGHHLGGRGAGPARQGAAPMSRIVIRVSVTAKGTTRTRRGNTEITWLPDDQRAPTT